VNKGKFKLSSINDFTAEKVEIELKATRGMDVEKLLKLLFAFTQCEVSISVNMLLIQENQPAQLSVSEVLRYNTLRLKDLLKQELLLSLEQARRKWHLRRMEMYFIGEKIYQKLEACDSYEEALEVVGKAMLQMNQSCTFRLCRMISKNYCHCRSNVFPATIRRKARRSLINLKLQSVH